MIEWLKILINKGYKNIMKEKETENKKLLLIPKIEEYIEYMLNLLIKLPRIEKFNIGNEYKKSMYEMLENVMYLNKIRENKECLILANKIDAVLNCQRVYLRIMRKNHWIDERKFGIAIDKIYEMGKIVGGLTKYYAKNN